MKFYLDKQYFTSVNIRSTHCITQRTDETESDFLFRKLSTDNVVAQSYSSIDHPEFTKLREQLGNLKYIEIQRGWWNGDRVIKPFTLNNKKFKTGDKFCCACALSFYME